MRVSTVLVSVDISQQDDENVKNPTDECRVDSYNFEKLVFAILESKDENRTTDSDQGRRVKSSSGWAMRLSPGARGRAGR